MGRTIEKKAKGKKPLFKQWLAPVGSPSTPPRRARRPARHPARSTSTSPEPPPISQFGDARFPTEGEVATPITLYMPSFAGGQVRRAPTLSPLHRPPSLRPSSSPSPSPSPPPRTPRRSLDEKPACRSSVQSTIVPDSQEAVCSPLHTPSPSPTLYRLETPPLRLPRSPKVTDTPGYRRRLERYRKRLEEWDRRDKQVAPAAGLPSFHHAEDPSQSMDLAEDDAEHSPAFEPELDTHDEELHDLNSNEQDSDEHISKPSSPGMALSESDAGDDTDSDEWSPGSDNGSSIHSDTSIEYRDTDNNDIEEELADLGDTDAETSIAAAEDVGSWQGDVGEEDVGMAGDDPLSETVSDREEEDKEDEVVQDATMEHSPSLEPILEDSQRSGGKPDSEASNSTTYSQAIIRATNERQRAEDTLLDLAHNVPGSVDEPEFPEWERKLENMNKLLIHWHRHDLPFNNERINVAIRTVRQHAAHLTRKRRDGGGAGNDREPKPAQEEESEDDDFKITNEFLSPAQRILLCKSAQELIDDLEQQPVIPTFGQDNLPDAIEAVQRRSQYLSAYFGLIKAGKALPWLQMRGPLAANLINIWTWHHEFGVEANLHHIQDVDLAFGQDWSLLGILRAVETSEVGSVDARHTIDLYSRTAVRAIINVSRPWPSFPNAPLIRVSAFMTLTNTHWRDTMNHRSLWQSPPTHFFATCLFELMRYTQKWHLTYDLESWPIPMMGFPVALLNQLVLELNNVAPPPKLFTDEDLANMEGGGRPVTADEVYEGIIRHTQHILKKHDRRIARVHAKYKRKSRRKAFGNILPDTLRAPSPLLEIEYIPPLRVARRARVVRMKKVFEHPVVLCFCEAMCLRCRIRSLHSRTGLRRSCRRIEGTGCFECRRRGVSCLWRKPGKKKISIKDWDEKSLKPNIRTLQFTMDDVDRALADKWYEGNADNDTAPPEEWVEIDDSEWLDVGTIEHLEKLDRKGRQKAAPLA